MAGCRSCSGRSAQQCAKPTEKAEKLQKVQTSGNPRYPHIFVGNQAIFTDENAQMIVTVLKDECDENSDCFRLRLLSILKGESQAHSNGKPFDVKQAAGENRWRLHALI